MDGVRTYNEPNGTLLVSYGVPCWSGVTGNNQFLMFNTTLLSSCLRRKIFVT